MPPRIAQASATTWSAMRKHRRAPARAVSEIVDTFKTLKDVMGGRGAGRKSEVTEIVNAIATLAPLEAKRNSKDPPEPPEPERRRSLMFRDGLARLGAAG